MRVQVLMSDEMVERVDFYAKKMGVSRSALCSMFVGQGIMAYDKSMDLLSSLGYRLGNSLVGGDTFQKLTDDVKN